MKLTNHPKSMEIGNGLLINNDCLIAMDELIAQGVKVDAIITDPPYWTTACKWDTIIPFDKMWERLNKLIKPNWAIVLFWSEPFSSALRMSNIKNYKYDWKWNKVKATNHLNSKRQPLRVFEDIIIFNTKSYNPQMQDREKVRINKWSNKELSDWTWKWTYWKHFDIWWVYNQRFPINEIKISNADKTNVLHPTQKPVALIEYLIKTYTNEWETVLDFTFGSGTTAIACLNTNRNFIGIEMDEKYFEIAQNRINNI